MPSQVKIGNISGSTYEEAKINARAVANIQEMIELLDESMKLVVCTDIPGERDYLIAVNNLFERIKND